MRRMVAAVAATACLGGAAAAPAGAVTTVQTDPFVTLAQALCVQDGGTFGLLKGGGFICDASGRFTLPAVQAQAICVFVERGQFRRVLGQGWECDLGLTTL